MTRRYDVAGALRRIDRDLDGAGTVEGRDAGRNPVACSIEMVKAV